MIAPAAKPSPTPVPTARLERFVAELEAVYEREKSAMGAEDAYEMRKRVRLSRFCAARGRTLITEARTPKSYAKGIWMLASHYIMEVTNGHAITHGIYDHLPDNHGLDSRTYEWANPVVVRDWAIDHNEIHHPFTNIVERDHDYGFNLFRVSEQQPWRPRHLLQMPLVFVGMPLMLTWYFPTFLAMARAEHEGRAPLSRETLGPVARKVLRHWWRNYVTESRRAGVKFPLSAVGHAVAQLVANTYILFMLGVEHHSDDIPAFPDDPNEPKEAYYLRQILGSKNFHTTREHEDLYTLSVNIHLEHHLFPDLSITRLRTVETELRAMCERHGIPHNSDSWPRAAWKLAKSVARFSLPVRATRERKARLALFHQLVGEVRHARAARAAQEQAPAPVTATHTLTLARSGRHVSAAANETLLAALGRAGVDVPTGCKKGACKTCVTRKLSGTTSLERKRSKQSVELCVAKPLSDVALDL